MVLTFLSRNTGEGVRISLKPGAFDLFNISGVRLVLPEKAGGMTSLPYGLCGEPAMGSKLMEKKGKKLCRDCPEE